MNYLRPDIKRGNITPDEDDLIIRLHSLLGNRWSLIAGRLPGRTDNEIKNYWNTHLSKKLRSQGTDPTTHKKMTEPPETKRRRSNTRPKTNNGVGGAGKRGKVGIEEDREKPKIHLPKPVRVTSLLSMSRNNSFDSNYTADSRLGGNRETLPCGNVVDGIDFFIGGDQSQDLVTSSDLESQCLLPPPAVADNSLEKLYEEYLQLLEREDSQVELDSFPDSLLI